MAGLETWGSQVQVQSKTAPVFVHCLERSGLAFICISLHCSYKVYTQCACIYTVHIHVYVQCTGFHLGGGGGGGHSPPLGN